MPKTKKKKPTRKPARAKPKPGNLPRKMTVYTADPGVADEAQVYASSLTLHELFQQQTSTMLERADLTDEQKQSLLIGMSCPCCGAGGFSFTAKLRR
jgi:hypothetical protein